MEYRDTHTNFWKVKTISPFWLFRQDLKMYLKTCKTPFLDGFDLNYVSAKELDNLTSTLWEELPSLKVFYQKVSKTCKSFLQEELSQNPGSCIRVLHNMSRVCDAMSHNSRNGGIVARYFSFFVRRWVEKTRQDSDGKVTNPFITHSRDRHQLAVQNFEEMRFRDPSLSDVDYVNEYVTFMDNVKYC